MDRLPLLELRCMFVMIKLAVDMTEGNGVRLKDVTFECNSFRGSIDEALDLTFEGIIHAWIGDSLAHACTSVGVWRAVCTVVVRAADNLVVGPPSALLICAESVISSARDRLFSCQLCCRPRRRFLRCVHLETRNACFFSC